MARTWSNPLRWRAPFVLAGLLAGAQPAIAVPSAPPPAPPPSTGSSSPPIGRAVIDDKLDVIGDDIAARQQQTRMLVPVWVSGHGPFRFVVDSGADRSVIGKALAGRLGLAAGQAITINNMGVTISVPTASVPSLRLGSRTIVDVTLPLLAEQDIGAGGMIGIDALAGQRVRLDFEKNLVTVEPPTASRGSASDEIVVTARRRKGQLILTQVAAERTSVDAVIDTGTQMTIGNMALRRHLLGSRPTTGSVEIVSVTGQHLTLDTAVIPNLTIGALTLQNVTVAFADLPPFALFGLERRPAMLLGTDLLSSFRRVSLDFANRRVRFQPRVRG